MATLGLGGAAPAHRDLRVHVVDEAGRPMLGTRVYLCGLDRGTLSADELMDESDPVPSCLFRTDARGNCTVRLGRFNPHQHDSVGTYAGPGDELYQLVAVKRGWAGGVSRMIVNLEDPDAYDLTSSRRPRMDEHDHREWQRGEFAPLVLRDQAGPTPLRMVLKRGLVVRG